MESEDTGSQAGSEPDEYVALLAPLLGAEPIDVPSLDIGKSSCAISHSTECLGVGQHNNCRFYANAGAGEQTAEVSATEAAAAAATDDEDQENALVPAVPAARAHPMPC